MADCWALLTIRCIVCTGRNLTQWHLILVTAAQTLVLAILYQYKMAIILVTWHRHHFYLYQCVYQLIGVSFPDRQKSTYWQICVSWLNVADVK